MVDYFLSVRPQAGGDVSGDAGIIRECGDMIFMGIIDALGHGQPASEIAVISMDFLQKQCRDDLTEIIEGLHSRLKGSRGAAVGLGTVDLKTGALEYAGIGNITARRFGSDQTRINSGLGVVGYEMRTPSKTAMELCDGDVFLLYTDGVKEHFELEDYPELLKDDARTIATRIVRQFGKETDDAACIALRYGGDD